MNPNIIWSIVVAVNALGVFFVAWHKIQKAKADFFVEGYKRCIIDCCKKIISKKAKEEGTTFNDTVEDFSNWMSKGFEDNVFDIVWGTRLDDDRTVFYVNAFGDTALEFKEVKEGDIENLDE